jgi:type I restriction enzyme S subunit
MGKSIVKLQDIRLDNIVEINPQNSIDGDIIKYIDISSVKEGKIFAWKEFVTADRPSRAQRKIKPDDIVISSVRPENKSYFFVNKNYDGFIASTGFIVIRPKIGTVYPRYLYYYLTRDEMINLYSMNTGG